MTQVLKATTSADFLAMVPTVAGFTAHDSLVCVMFSGNRTCGAIRFDLPRQRREADYRVLANAVIAMLSRADKVDRVAPVVYTNASFESERGIPWLDLSRVLERRLRAEGFAIVELACVAGDGWASYLDRDRPRTGRPLAEISASELTTEAERARGGEAVPDFETLYSLPHRDPAAAAKLDEEFELLLDEVEVAGNWDSGADEVTVEQVIALGAEAPISLVARLLLQVQSHAERDAVTLQIAFGLNVGARVRHDNRHYARLQSESGLSMDEVMRRELQAGRTSLDDDAGLMLMGQYTQRPDVDRIRGAIRALGPASANMPLDLSPNPMCILAWLSWAMGLSSSAGKMLDVVRKIEPDHGMAGLLRALVGSGGPPDWAFTDVQSSVQEDQP